MIFICGKKIDKNKLINDLKRALDKAHDKIVLLEQEIRAAEHYRFCVNEERESEFNKLEEVLGVLEYTGEPSSRVWIPL